MGRAAHQLGAPDLFGLIGSGNLRVTNAFRAAGGRFLALRHEGNAIVAADAYARTSGMIGLCTVHQGPGLSNTATGLVEAAKSRTPLVVLAAETAAAAVRSNFRMDQTGFAQSLGAVAERIHSPATAVADTLRAFERARRERRPVVLNLPLDVQAGECDPPGELHLLELRPPRAHPAALAELAEFIDSARRPVFIAGRGAVYSQAREAIERCADRAGALLATSAVAYGLFAGSPWYLATSGGFSSPTAAELIAGADLIVTWGATFNTWTSRHGKLGGPAARIVQVDVDPDQPGAHVRCDLAVLGDAGEVATELAALLGARQRDEAGYRTPEIAERLRRAHWRDEPFEDVSGAGRIDPRALTIALDRLLPAERNLAVDSGHFMGWAPMYMDVPDGRSFTFTQSFQSIGLGLASAIGTAVARPDRVTVAALGDGGALMSLADLETPPRLGLDMAVVVYDDAAYGAEVHHFGPDGDDLTTVRFPETDFAALARAAGYEAVTVRALEDLEALSTWSADRRRPLLVDAKVVPTVVAEWLEEAFRGH